ncbi:MAG: hypothetical protein AB1746_16290 [Candidatus Zixiibacteriota bacterium]
MIFHTPYFLCTFLWRKEKYPKETSPRSLATPQAWLPSLEEFFGAKMNSPRFQRGSDSIFAFPEKSSSLGCAATGGGLPLMSGPTERERIVQEKAPIPRIGPTAGRERSENDLLN